MRHRLRFLVMSSLLAALASGCEPTLAPVFAPASAAGLTQSGAPHTLEQVESAVAAGAQAKGWTIVERTPGVVVAETHAGAHQARVRVLVSEGGWRIEHEQSSPGLKYGQDPRHGAVIHRRYNHWVRLLDDSIRQALATPSTAGPTSGASAAGPASAASAPAEPAPATGAPAPATGVSAPAQPAH